MEKKNNWSFRLAVAANISQVLSLFTQILGMSEEVSPFFNFMLLSSITAIGIFATLQIILQTSPLSSLQSQEAKRLSKLTKYAKRILISISAVFLLYIGLQMYQALSTDKLTVVIVNFSERSDPTSVDRTTSQLIADKLQQTVGNQKNVEIISVLDPLEVVNSNSAVEIGRRYGASIIIWGWYTVRQNDVLINPHFEVLINSPNLQPFQLYQQIIPRSSFESFDFELALSDDYSYLTAFTIGTIRYSQQKYIDAIDSYSKIIEQNKTNRDISLVYNMRGLSYSNFGQPYKASQDYLRAIELSPNDPIYFYNLGSSQLDTGEVEKAIANFRHATELDPNFSSPLNSLAIIYHTRGNLGLAEDYYNKAIQLSPNEIIYRVNIADLYFERMDYDQALEQLDAVLQSVPMAWSLHFSKAHIFYKQQKYGLALRELVLFLYFSQPAFCIVILVCTISFFILFIVNKNQGGRLSNWVFPKILFGISVVILKLFRFKKRNSVEHRRNITTRILAFGVLMQLTAYLISDNESQAVSLIKSAISRGIQNTELLVSLGNYYFEQDEYALATKVYLDVLKLDEQNGHAHYGFGWIYAENGNLPMSIISFQRATSSPPHEVIAWLLGGDLHWTEGDIRGALVSWNKAAQKDPQYVIERTLKGFSDFSQILSPLEHFKLGLAYNQLGNEENAKKGFETAINQGKFSLIAPYAELRLSSLKARLI